MKCKNKIIEVRNFLRKIALFFVAGFAFLVSCDNEHCDEVMYTPLRIDLYGDMDTLKKATPFSLLMMGIGTDSILDFSYQSQITLPLNSGSNTSRFAMALTDGSCEISAMKLINGNKFVDFASGDTVIFQKKIENFYIENDFYSAKYKLDESDSIYYFLKPAYDTLLILYHNQYEFVSAECGCLTSQLLFNIKFENDGFGIITLLNPMINNKNNEANAKIFLKNH